MWEDPTSEVKKPADSMQKYGRPNEATPAAWSAEYKDYNAPLESVGGLKSSLPETGTVSEIKDSPDDVKMEDGQVSDVPVEVTQKKRKRHEGETPEERAERKRKRKEKKERKASAEASAWGSSHPCWLNAWSGCCPVSSRHAYISIEVSIEDEHRQKTKKRAHTRELIELNRSRQAAYGGLGDFCGSETYSEAFRCCVNVVSEKAGAHQGWSGLIPSIQNDGKKKAQRCRSNDRLVYIYSVQACRLCLLCSQDKWQISDNIWPSKPR